MLYFRRSPYVRRVILPLTLLAFLSACHKWVPLYTQAITEEEPGTVRVTLADNSRVVLKEPHISGDSLIALDDTVGVPLEEVQRVEEKRANTPATVFLILGAAVLAFFALGVIAMEATYGDSGG